MWQMWLRHFEENSITHRNTKIKIFNCPHSIQLAILVPLVIKRNLQSEDDISDLWLQRWDGQAESGGWQVRSRVAGDVDGLFPSMLASDFILGGWTQHRYLRHLGISAGSYNNRQRNCLDTTVPPFQDLSPWGSSVVQFAVHLLPRECILVLLVI